MARYLSRIAIFAYTTCSIRRPRRNTAITFGVEKLPDGETTLKICLFISTEYTNVTHTDGRIDEQIPHDDIGGAYAQHRAAKSGSNSFCCEWC